MSKIKAIVKYLTCNYDMGNSKLSTSILKSLNTGVKAGRFEKIRASFKVSKAWIQKQKSLANKKLKVDDRVFAYIVDSTAAAEGRPGSAGRI